jgi:DNA-binding phage protein
MALTLLNKSQIARSLDPMADPSLAALDAVCWTVTLRFTECFAGETLAQCVG